MREDAIKAAPPYPDVALRAPCSVMRIAPSQAPDADTHKRALEGRLNHAWPIYHEPPHRVRDWVTLQHIWRQRRPRMVYYYGAVEQDDQDLYLLLDNTAGGVERIAVSQLHALWRGNPPQMVFLNLVGESIDLGVSIAPLHAPLVITQFSREAEPARRSALDWLSEILEGGEGTDPVLALHDHGLPTAVAWGAYGDWKTETVSKPAREQLPKLLIDRNQQRSLGQNAVRDLVRDQQRRVCCVLAFGAEGNLVDLFPEQLFEHLRRDPIPEVQISRERMWLPDSSTFDESDIDFTLRKHLRLDQRQEVVDELAKRQLRGAGVRIEVMLLNWGVRSTQAKMDITPSALEAWLSFCKEKLASKCPADMRLVCCLSLLTTDDPNQTELNRIKNEWLPTSAFRLVVPQRLDHIELSDLAEFLVSEHHTSCPSELIPEISSLILQETGGRFQSTVELVEQREKEKWYVLRDALAAKFGEPQINDTSKEDAWS